MGIMKTCHIYQCRFSSAHICVAKTLGTGRYLCRDPRVLTALSRLRANGNLVHYMNRKRNSYRHYNNILDRHCFVISSAHRMLFLCAPLIVNTDTILISR